jgi:hypothetical protein
MSILDNIITTEAGAPRITIFGKPGIGKSTLAAQFPDPLFILCEDNELSGIKAFPVAHSFNEVWKTVKGLLAEEHLSYKTIVIDSISKLDHLIVEYILENEPIGKNGQKPNTLNAACGGYGAGVLKAASLHAAFKGLMDKFKERGICVVYVGHVGVVKHKAPDQEDYDQYSITMNHDKSRAVYIDDTDCVFFCKLKSFVVESDSGRNMVRSTNERIVITGVSDGHVSKNRFNMPAELKMEFAEISKHIPFFNLETK